ncbi:SDR family oxidoreductase [Desulfobulbus rhabdoformis]|jgi:meso-butanediol dehydrogenase/(S,S)-butanediol dehydrogenase/diacetyl reductase|uniref:SDR family NAD(P)-dependent oxidoreductase n=1 Tax=Desulfobulbus rhabdoformis TaxID=34032 RepID=UPI0019647482|nr:SDR family NAD(P)-dependent oxidoreductase [Desulfobulbus rhabdoformis]MBM9614024.1 SDR family oxidoreductase [Desulfobulbus rhabdoformis]
MKLQDRVALVTGGGRGIGRGIALELAKEGCSVAVADMNLNDAQSVAAEIQALGRTSLAIQVNVTDWDDVQKMVQTTVETLGKLDIICNNAGVISIKSVEELTPEDWDFVLDVNAKGVFMCCKAAIPELKKNGWGRIINTASIAGKEGFPQLSHYAASKFAVVGFTVSLAKELQRDNITVNSICPGIVPTQMWYGPNGLADKWKLEGETMEESWKRHQDILIPQGEGQTPQDMGQLAVFFATQDHITAQNINVDGGFTWH